MGIEWNTGQKYILDKAVKWYNNQYSDQVYEFSGGPGSGKTTVLLGIADALGIPLHRIACMAYIGQAAINMRTKGLYTGKTIHSWIFDTKKNPDYNKINEQFNRPTFTKEFVLKNLYDIDLIMIDEGPSVPLYLKEYIESYGIKIIATGDLDQLPPVGDKPAYLTDESKVDRLTEIMRQAEGSGIVYLSQRAIKGLPIHKGFYGDVLVIDRDELTDEMILYSDVIICGKNNTRDILNKKVREELLHIQTDLPIIGEKMICKKNNWYKSVDGINLANGLAGVVTNMPSVSGFDGKQYSINFRPNMLNASFIDLKCDYKYLIAPYDQRAIIKNDKYSYGEKFEFGYGITCHSAQGSQYNAGIFIEEFLSPTFHKNLVYTGISRFRQSLIFVKYSKKYF